jgi:hypothetical protein
MRSTTVLQDLVAWAITWGILAAWGFGFLYVGGVGAVLLFGAYLAFAHGLSIVAERL